MWQHLNDGGPKPWELIGLELIDRFGAGTVYGRSLGVGELLRMTYCENLAAHYEDKQSQENWAAWVEANPKKDRLLMEALKAAQDAK